MATHFPSLDLPHARRARARLASDLHTLVRDAERLIDAAGDDLTDQARAARRQFDKTVARIRETTSAWREQGAAALQEGDRIVRENPYRSIGIGLAVGVLVGWCLRRR